MSGRIALSRVTNSRRPMIGMTTSVSKRAIAGQSISNHPERFLTVQRFDYLISIAVERAVASRYQVVQRTGLCLLFER